MWIAAYYRATTLFSLKPATATASGGRTLLVPTPFAIKMALVDVACRQNGIDAARRAWDWLRTLTVAVSPAQRVVVNNTFMKILRPRRNPAAPGSQDEGFFGRTIAYREFAYMADPFGIAFELPGDAQPEAEQLALWMLGLQYLGKRGGFVQITEQMITLEDALPADFIPIDGQITTFPLDSMMTQLDDSGSAAPFERVDIYSGKSIRMGQDRVLRHVILPYRLVSSSRGYSYYELAQVGS
jgi:hypothetical protein